MEVVCESDREWTEYDNDQARFRRKRLAADTEAEALGCSLHEIPPGERAWPYHYHTNNEEAIYVLAGSGQVRVPDDHEPLQAGDYVVLPADERGAHRVVNDGEATFRYLAISTMNEPGVLRYPDSGKFGVYVGVPPGHPEDADFHGFYDEDATVGFWDR
jgi:uncharacterized cupin superfamily protein